MTLIVLYHLIHDIVGVGAVSKSTNTSLDGYIEINSNQTSLDSALRTIDDLRQELLSLKVFTAHCLGCVT